MNEPTKRDARTACPINAQQALQRLDDMTPQRREPRDLLEMAVTQGASVDTLERLMVVRKELRAEQAEAEFNAAMSAFQSECPIILRNKEGHENRYRYAPLEKIVQIVTPFLARHGFSHESDGIVTEGWVEALVTVKHRAGHSITKRFKVPAESRAGMSPAQKYGAAMTYATRYAFCSAFGIRTADKDTDCPPDASESVTSLTAKLWSAVQPICNGDKTWKTARRWLTDECNMDSGRRVQDHNADEIRALIETAKARMKELGIV